MKSPISFGTLFHGAFYFVYPDKIRKSFLVFESNLGFILFGTLFRGVFYFILSFEKNCFQVIRPQLV